MATMKRYWDCKKDGVNTGNKYVTVFEQCEEKDCTLCRAMNTALDTYLVGSNRGLCSGNLKAHLKSGKHWKQIDSYYTDKTRRLNYEKFEAAIKSYINMVAEGTTTTDEALNKIMYLILTNAILNLKGGINGKAKNR
jgi:hypothetical protein